MEHLQVELTQQQQQQSLPQVSVPMSIGHSQVRKKIVFQLKSSSYENFQPPPLPVMHNQSNLGIPPPQFGMNQAPANMMQPDFSQAVPNYPGPPNYNPTLPTQSAIKPATAFDYQHGKFITFYPKNI